MKKKDTPKQYQHLAQTERDRIQALLAAGHKQKEIASILKRDAGTISREIKRNRRKIRKKGGTRDGPYEATPAHHKAYVKRKYSKYQGKKIQEDSSLRQCIIEGLQLFWSPDEISGRMRDERKPFYASKTAIYEWLYSSHAQRWCVYLYSRRYRSRKHKRKTKRALIPHRRGITERPLGATNKTRYGHYEGDTMVSGKKTGSKEALSVAYERKAKYIVVKKINDLRPKSNNQAIAMMQKELVMKSLTMDNGIENTGHEELGIPTFFCDPYSSWQKGGVENANKMIRRYFPKGTDFADVLQKDIDWVVSIINNKPRKSLGYKKSYEVMKQHNLLVEQAAQKRYQLLNPVVALRG